jgi:hypothetical protein
MPDKASSGVGLELASLAYLRFCVPMPRHARGPLSWCLRQKRCASLGASTDKSQILVQNFRFLPTSTSDKHFIQVLRYSQLTSYRQPHVERCYHSTVELRFYCFNCPQK